MSIDNNSEYFNVKNDETAEGNDTEKVIDRIKAAAELNDTEKVNEETADDETAGVDDTEKADNITEVKETEDSPVPDKDESISIVELEETNKEVRPRLNKEIKYKVCGEKEWRKGKVWKVGKKSGKDKFRAWIKSEEEDNNFDFSTDIASWKYCHILFEKDIDKDEELEATAMSEKLHTGIWFLQNKNYLNFNEEKPEVNKVFAVEIPNKYHNHADIVNAKKDELNKWKEYEAFEVIYIQQVGC